MNNNNLAVIVLSCDKFSCLWPLFFSRLNKYFPENTYKFYLLSNNIKFEADSHHDINVICVGDDISWSDNLIKMLDKVNEKYVMLLIDDAPFAADVDIKKLNNYFSTFINENMNYLNLKSSPKPNKNFELDHGYGEISKSTGYRCALVPSIWKKNILYDLLKISESAWEFEVIGSERSKKYDRFFSLVKPIFNFDHIIVKGKIERKVYKKLRDRNEHLGINFPVMTTWEYISDNLLIIRSKFLTFLLPEFVLLYIRKIRYSNQISQKKS